VITPRRLVGQETDRDSLVCEPLRDPFTVVDVKTLDPKPLAIFTFNYRTRRKDLLVWTNGLSDSVTGALQTLMILDRSQTPVPLEERPLEDLTREEMAELIRRQRVCFPQNQSMTGTDRFCRNKVPGSSKKASTNGEQAPPCSTCAR
jgi:hypothetical protein